jgi:Bacterial dnaA protein helix-turn-helix
MQAFASILHVRPPPGHRAQFLWIVEAVTQRTNELRGGICLISAQSLFDPRPGPYTKSPRLLTVFLARKLLGWPYSTINAIYSPSSYPHSTNLTTQARKWVSSGCFDALSGRSMAPVKDHVLSAFASVFPPLPQNPAESEPPDPPPRSASPQPEPASQEILRPKPRKVGTVHILKAVIQHYGITAEALLAPGRRPEFLRPRQIGMYLARRLTRTSCVTIARRFGRHDHTTVRHAAMKIGALADNDIELQRELGHLARKARALSREEETHSGQPAQSLQTVTGARVLLPAPYGNLAETPFIRLLHPRLIKAAAAMELSAGEFIADMIAEATARKAAVSPLTPQLFLQVLAHASLDVPERLVPHAMLIQRTLYNFATLLPTRASLQAPAAVIRSVKPYAARAGD